MKFSTVGREFVSGRPPGRRSASPAWARMTQSVTAFSLVCVMSSLSGCATPYQKRGLTGGYDDFRITEDTFEVKFAGDGYTRPEKVGKYVLRRASEVRLLHGFVSFLPLGQTDESGYMTMYSSSGQAHAYGDYQAAHAYGSSSGYGVTIRKPETSMRIKCFNEPSPEIEGLIDARQFLEYNFHEALAELDSERSLPSDRYDSPGKERTNAQDPP